MSYLRTSAVILIRPVGTANSKSSTAARLLESSNNSTSYWTASSRWIVSIIIVIIIIIIIAPYSRLRKLRAIETRSIAIWVDVDIVKDTTLYHPTAVR